MRRYRAVSHAPVRRFVNVVQFDGQRLLIRQAIVVCDFNIQAERIRNRLEVEVSRYEFITTREGDTRAWR